MIGSRKRQPVPTGPRRLLSFSRDRVRYSSEAGVLKMLVGLFFIFLSCLVTWLIAMDTLARLGLVEVQPPPEAKSFLEILLGIAAVFLWVTCFFGLGVYMLNTLRTVIDRRANCVTVRSGLLGWKRERRTLSEFRWITVIERVPRFLNGEKHEWEIVLLGESVEPLTIGIATIEIDLATTFANHVSQFTGLKLTAAATSSNFAAKSVVIDPL